MPSFYGRDPSRGASRNQWECRNCSSHNDNESDRCWACNTHIRLVDDREDDAA